MNDNPTLRPFESYLDEVAKEKLNQSYEVFLTRIDLEIISAKTVNSIVTEANRRMLEDAFKSQKEICAEHAKFGIYDNNGGAVYNKVMSNKNHTVAIDRYSILEAPTPKTINQNKN